MAPDHPLRRLAGFARPYRRNAVLATVFSVLNKIFDVLPELLIGVAVDVVVNQQDSFLAGFGLPDPLHQLYVLVALTVVIWMAESLFEYLYALKWRGLAQDLQHALRQAAYGHLQKLPPALIERERSGRLMALMNEDVNQIERFLNTGANDLIQVVVSSLLVGGVFFVLTADLAALAMLPIPLILVGAFWFQKRLAPRYAAAREAAATVSARLNNNLAGMATIQAYTAEEFEAEHLRQASDGFRARNAEAIRFSAAITPVIRMAILAGFVATLLYGGMLTLRGELGVGSYSALVYLTQRLLWPLTRLADMTDLYQRAMASVNRVMDLLDTPVPARGSAALQGKPRGELAFDNVGYDYDNRPAVQGVSLLVPAGQTVALVGGTGGGKSTLLKLLLRFLDPARGRITLDGADLAGVDPASLRRVVGYVAQEPFLTDGSVADNIAYGERAPDRARVEAAARARPKRTPSSRRCRPVTTARSANAAATSAAASASASPWRARCTATRRSWCWTKPPRRWTTKPKRRSSIRWPPPRAAAPRSWLHTGSAPCAMLTPSTCWTPVASSNRAPMTNWWRAMAPTPRCGGCRPVKAEAAKGTRCHQKKALRAGGLSIGPGAGITVPARLPPAASRSAGSCGRFRRWRRTWPCPLRRGGCPAAGSRRRSGGPWCRPGWR
nr:ABC transporter transmembrane domain-containing protein [Arenimonas daejeonensis]